MHEQIRAAACKQSKQASKQRPLGQQRLCIVREATPPGWQKCPSIVSSHPAAEVVLAAAEHISLVRVGLSLIVLWRWAGGAGEGKSYSCRGTSSNTILLKLLEYASPWMTMMMMMHGICRVGEDCSVTLSHFPFFLFTARVPVVAQGRRTGQDMKRPCARQRNVPPPLGPQDNLRQGIGPAA